MRLHFTLPLAGHSAYQLAVDALNECKDAGTIARHVGFKTLTEHRSGGDGFIFALEVQLEASQRDRGRRAGNTGGYGASTGWGGDGSYAATYDEWGFFLAALYRRDPLMRCAPNFKRDYSQYHDAEDFHHKTGRTYDPSYPPLLEQWEAVEDQTHPNFGRIDDYRYRAGRNQIGRRGAGRVHIEDNGTRWAKLDIRSPEWLRQLQNGEVF